MVRPTFVADVAASNSYLSKLGSGRRRSWMTSSASVLPTPRPKRPPAPPTQSTPQPEIHPDGFTKQPQGPQRQPDQPQGLPLPQESQPPSRQLQEPKARPQDQKLTLPHQPQQPHQQQTRSEPQSQPQSQQEQPHQERATNVLPSPAPSDESSPPVSTSHDIPDVNPNTAVHQTMASQSPTIEHPLPLAEDGHAGRRVGFAGSPEVLSAVDTTARTFRPYPAPSHSPKTTSLPPSTNELSINDNDQRNNNNNNNNSSSSNNSRNINNSDGSIATANATTYQGLQTHTPIHTPLQSPHVQPGTVQVPAAKRRRTNANSTNQTERIEAHLAALGGERNINSEIDRARIILLRDASKIGDNLFISAHQVFCRWTLDRLAVHGLFPHLQPDSIDRACIILEGILRKNEDLSMRNLGFFANFPILLTSGTGLLQPVAAFFWRLSENWYSLGKQRPLLVSEMITVLGCSSATFQRILFTSSRRTAGIDDSPIAKEVEDLFSQDQMAHLSGDGRFIQVPHFNSLQELEECDAPLVSHYHELVARAKYYRLQVRMSAGSIAPRPNLSQSFLTSWPDGSHATHSAQGLTQDLYQQHPHANIQQLPQQQGQQQQSQQQQRQLQQQLMQIRQHQLWPASNQISSSRQQQQQHHHHQQRRPRQIPQQLQTIQTTNLHEAGSLNGILQAPQVIIPQNQTVLPSSLIPQNQTNIQTQGLSFLAGGPLMSTQVRRSSAPQCQTSQLQQPQQPQRPQFPSQLIPRVQPQSPRAMGPLVTSPTSLLGPSGPGGNITPIGVLNKPLLPLKGQMLPRQEWAHDPYHESSLKMSLHQVHLRSPTRMKRRSSLLSDSNTQERFYQFVMKYSVRPTAIPPRPILYEFHIDMDEATMALLSKNAVPANEPTAPIQEYFDGSLRFRLRCCRFRNNVDSSLTLESEWAMMDTSWPQNIFMLLNGKTALTPRRQTHNGKDLPIELTDYLVEGRNTITVSVPRGSDRVKDFYHALAVEVVETRSQTYLIDFAWKNRLIRPEVTLNKIKDRLRSTNDKDAGGRDDDDDGLTVLVKDLSIDLADPFSAKIFRIPARGASCTHMECFDLENWLATRESKPASTCGHRVPCSCPKRVEPSVPDKWKCPHCRKDARPYSLQIDGFLLNVRNALEHQGKLKTKTLLVAADGSWRPVVEKEEEGDDEEEEEEEEEEGARGVGGGPPASAAVAQRPAAEVIELLDDD